MRKGDVRDCAENRRLLVHMRFQPLWLYVDAVREFCTFLIRTTFDSKSMAQRIEVVVHELVENAIRYGGDDSIELRIEEDGNTITVCVENSLSRQQATRLAEALGRLESLSPEEAYRQALAEAASLPSTESGVGLARLRLEGQVALGATFSGERVSMSATGGLKAEPSAA